MFTEKFMPEVLSFIAKFKLLLDYTIVPQLYANLFNETLIIARFSKTFTGCTTHDLSKFSYKYEKKVNI